MKKLLIALLMIPALARAEFETGNSLYQKIQNNSNMEQMYVLGYVGGVFDALHSVAHCPPPNLTLGQVTDVVKNYLAQNPAIRHRTADVLVREILQKTWPCANRNGRGA